VPEVAYHLRELRAVLDPADPLRVVPSYPCAGWKVLDVGCGIGQTLLAPELRPAAELHGIDTDRAAIDFGLSRAENSRLRLTCAPAEKIPYADAAFDLVYCRVALPYTDVPVALAEMHRVLKPDGRLWLALHPVRMEMARLRAALAGLHLKTVIDSGYVLANSMLVSLFGRCIPRPWNGKYESVQTRGGMARLLRRTGFRDVQTVLSHHFIVTARRS
jgi:ubiquinone/menaquinone biosynthesis C-methylase UbiE